MYLGHKNKMICGLCAQVKMKQGTTGSVASKRLRTEEKGLPSMVGQRSDESYSKEASGEQNLVAVSLIAAKDMAILMR